MSVFGNIAFPLKVRGLPGHSVNAKVKQVIDLLGLEELSGTNVRSLSGGAQQRVSIEGLWSEIQILFFLMSP